MKSSGSLLLSTIMLCCTCITSAANTNSRKHLRGEKAIVSSSPSLDHHPLEPNDDANMALRRRRGLSNRNVPMVPPVDLDALLGDTEESTTTTTTMTTTTTTPPPETTSPLPETTSSPPETTTEESLEDLILGNSFLFDEYFCDTTDGGSVKVDENEKFDCDGMTGVDCREKILAETKQEEETVQILPYPPEMNRRYLPCRITIEVDVNGNVTGNPSRG